MENPLPDVLCRGGRVMKYENGPFFHVKIYFFSFLFFQPESPFDAFRFETKGCSNSNIDTKHFEFVLVNDPYLSTFAEFADTQAFSEHFEKKDDSTTTTTTNPTTAAAVIFSNLGYNAILIVPQPQSDDNVDDIESVYGHCANFVRYAPPSQVYKTWKMVATAYLDRIEKKDEEPVWLSTAGTGVRWLHFRLDDRPKYYRYQPFKNET